MGDINFGNILNETEVYLKFPLNRKPDLQTILEICINTGNTERFEELAFSGKYLRGLTRVLKKGAEISEVESLDHVKKDLSENMQKMIDSLRNVLINETELTKQHFEQTYFILSQSSFQNLNELLADFESVKKYLNYKKRQTA